MPEWVAKLESLPDGAVLDLASNAPLALYYQTAHHKPIAFGYISRTPTSVDEQDQRLAALIKTGNWDMVSKEYAFAYVVKGDRSADVMTRGLNDVALPAIDEGRRVYTDGTVSIYQF
jgi:hypothetical protein